MPLDPALLKSMIAAAAGQAIAHASELAELDQAIGDGDPGINMKPDARRFWPISIRLLRSRLEKR